MASDSDQNKRLQGGDLMESTKPMLTESLGGTTVDWKTQLPVDYRRMVVNKLSEWILRNISVGMREASKVESMARNFEEKVFSVASSKEDYRQKIYLKIQQPIKPRPQQSMPSSSPPSPVGNSIDQASPHGDGRPMVMQPGLPEHPLRHQRPVSHHQGTNQNKQNPTLIQNQNINTVNSQSNVQHKVPDLLSQHKVYGINNRSTGIMHRSGQQVNATTFNEQPKNIGMQCNQGGLQRAPQNGPQTQAQQAQPPLLQTLGLQPGEQQPNLQIVSQMHAHPQENADLQGTSQAIHSVGDNWKEDLFNKITYLKNSFLPALMVKQGEVVNMLRKMSSIPQYQRPAADYERLQKQLIMHKKVYNLLNFSKDKMCEKVRIWLPQCEKLLYILLQARTQGHIAIPPQNKLPTTAAQSLKQPQYQTKQQMVTSQEEEDTQLHHQNLSKLRKQRGSQQQLPTFNLLAHHSSQPKQAINVKPIKCMGNIWQKESLVNNSLNNHQLVKPEPVSVSPDMKILDESSPNIGNCSPSTFSIDSPHTSSVQSLVNVSQSLVHNPDNGTLPSSLLAENANINGKQFYNLGTDMSKTILSEEPIQRLIKAVRSISPYALRASVRGMESVLRMVDSTASQVTVSESQFSVDNLAAVTTYRYAMERDVSSQTTQKESYETTIPVSSFGSWSIDDGRKASHLESSIATIEKKQRIEAISISCNTFSSCDIDMKMLDTTAGQIDSNGPENGQDLASFATFCYGVKQEVSPQIMQRNLHATAIPVCFSESEMTNHQAYAEASHLEFIKANYDSKLGVQVKCNLLEEIRKINLNLIETVVEISEEDVSKSSFPKTRNGDGTVVRCCYTPVAISPNLKYELESSPLLSIMPLNLLVPINYPAFSPVILDKLPSESSMDHKDLSGKAKLKLKLGLQVLREPISLADIAKTWDCCGRAVISEFAKQLGGGNFGSTFGTWTTFS